MINEVNRNYYLVKLSYLFDMIPIVLLRRLTRNISNIVLFKVKREYFRNSFSPPTAIWWNKLDNNT